MRVVLLDSYGRRESPGYGEDVAPRALHSRSEEECAALAIAEAATDLPKPEERIAAVASARLVLSDEQVAAIQWIAVAMNAFNRISILSRHPVKERELEKTGK